jgi:hypothetical protein
MCNVKKSQRSFEWLMFESTSNVECWHFLEASTAVFVYVGSCGMLNFTFTVSTKMNIKR